MAGRGAAGSRATPGPVHPSRATLEPPPSAPALAVVGAFPFPVPQGSQAYAAGQARALARAGARVTLVCYGRGAGRAPGDLDVMRTPASLSPRRLRAGPAPGKPLADAVLVATLLRAHARRRFDAVLAHNAEAALAALAARAFMGLPAIYVAHTLLGRELPCYAPRALAPVLERVGSGIDAALARRADGVIALSEHAAHALAARARGPVEVIPPGLDPSPAPSPEALARACARHALPIRRYVVYAGNLDAYQGLEALASAAEALPATPVVAVTHAEPPAPAGALRFVRVADAAEARALVHAAALAVLPRRVPGGFPIKLLNYMEAARPIVAHRDVAAGLEHDRSAWLLDPGAGPDALAAAIAMLLRDGPRAERLGRGARAAALAGHAWGPLAARTLQLIARVVDGAPARRGGHRGAGPARSEITRPSIPR